MPPFFEPPVLRTASTMGLSESPDSRVDELSHDLFRDVHVISLKLLAVTL